MARTHKIAVAAAIGALALCGMLALVFGPKPVTDGITPVDMTENRATRVLARCRTITMPESDCDAAWEAERRHFFGQGVGK